MAEHERSVGWFLSFLYLLIAFLFFLLGVSFLGRLSFIGFVSFGTLQSLFLGLVIGRVTANVTTGYAYSYRSLTDFQRNKEFEALIKWVDGLSDIQLSQIQAEKIEEQRSALRQHYAHMLGKGGADLGDFVSKTNQALDNNLVEKNQPSRLTEVLASGLKPSWIPWFEDAIARLSMAERTKTKTKLFHIVGLPLVLDIICHLGDGKNRLSAHMENQDALMFSRLLFEYHIIYSRLKGHGMILDSGFGNIGQPFQYSESYEEFIFFLSRKSFEHDRYAFDPRWLLRIRWLTEVVDPDRTDPAAENQHLVASVEAHIGEWCFLLSNFFSDRGLGPQFSQINNDVVHVFETIQKRNTGQFDRDLVQFSWLLHKHLEA